MENKLWKPDLTNYNFLMAQDLWEAYYQVLLIILMNKFIKSTVNIDMVIKNVKHLELNTKNVSAELNTQTLAMSYYYANVSIAIGITKNVWWTLKKEIF